MPKLLLLLALLPFTLARPFVDPWEGQPSKETTALAEAGLSQAYPDGLFRPSEEVSRAAPFRLAAALAEEREEPGGGRLEARRSSGCGKPLPETPPRSVLVDGQARELIAYLPQSYSPDTPLALVIAFHGRTNDNAQVRRYYGLEAPSQGEAVIVYPSGLWQGDGTFSWSDPGDPADALRDYALFDHMLEDMSESYCLDPGRVYLVGHSLGGWFAASLACARAETVRAVAVVAGSVSPSPCGAPVAALVLHNPEDHLVAFEAGLRVRDLFVTLNRCEGPPLPAEPRGLGCQRYPSCAGGNVVVWCPYEQSLDYRGELYPHVWPDEASVTIWDFFRSLE
ncbi:hypothetical protein BH24DEI1_BH24DEI1_07110 [soil metagenome]